MPIAFSLFAKLGTCLNLTSVSRNLMLLLRSRGQRWASGMRRATHLAGLLAGLAWGASGGMPLVHAQSADGAGPMAGPASNEVVRKALQQRVGARVPVQSVVSTPIPGLFEVRIGRELIYTDATGRYVLQGELRDLQTGENLTEARQAELNRIRWADLPLDQAFKWTKGDGSRVLAVFSDPNCGYCKRLEKTLQQLDNVTVHTFLIPILSPDSEAKSQRVWCASDRSKVWLDWMLRGTSPAGEGSCKTPLEKNLELAKNLGVTGTPAIFFKDGSRVPGAVGADELERRLAKSR